jgi:threonine/homoserine/homoserine lactone efflux protein
MFDSNFREFAIMAGVLVISPGASMAVVTDMALHRGRGAALGTVAGINLANSSLALASMFGLSAVFHHGPILIRAVGLAGALYLTWLGARSLRGKVQRPDGIAPRGSRTTLAGEAAAVVQGIMTNLLNPSVVLFYMLLLPQFIRADDPFFPRFLLLAGTHVTMSVLWLSGYSFAVGTLSERLARPRVRRTMEIITGILLIFLGVKLALR